jgi:DNA-binding PadR family transcriptional regulator
MERHGWVEALQDGSRRRPYRLTAHGQQVLRQQLATVDRVAAVGRRRLALG